MALSKMIAAAEPMDMDLESTFDNQPMPLNDEVIAIADFGDLTSSQFDAPIDLTCPHCNKSFAQRCSLNRHLKVHEASPDHKCPICQKAFYRKDILSKHLNVHKKVSSKVSTRPAAEVVAGPSTAGPSRPLKRQHPQIRPHCLGTFDVYKLYPTQETVGDLQLFLESVRDELSHRIRHASLEHHGIKWYINVRVLMVRLVSETEEETCTPHFRSKCEITLADETPNIQEAINKVQSSMEEYEGRGSGWILHSVQYLELQTAVYQPLAASSYIPLPKVLANKKAILNVQNEDQKCLIWSVLAALHPVEHGNHPHRVSHYQAYESDLNLEGITFPTPLHQLDRFEKQNGLSINVFGYENGEILPLKITSNRHGDRHINLMLIADDENRHYCFIKSMSRLLAGLTKCNQQAFYCDFCLHRFAKKETLDAHIEDCKQHGPQKIKMPTEKWLHFNSSHFQLPVPYIMYADFECILMKRDVCLPDSNISSTTAIANHIPSGFCYCIVGPDGKFYRKPVTYHGENAVDYFLSALLEEEEKISKILKTNIPMTLTPDDQQAYNSAKDCHICHKPLNGDKVKDHDHLTGRFRGAAHNACNLNFKYGSYIPVVIHNLRGYDSHLIMQGLGKCKGKNLSCIPNNSEKFISFSVGNLRFIDSLQFLNTSLEKLVANLEHSQFYLTRQYFGANTDLMLRKGVFPYEYLDSLRKLDEPQLPTKTAFYSSLTESGITDADYTHAHNVWNTFGCHTLADYQDVYVASDVVLLADVFENFRKLCLDFYGLDPAHCFTAPGLAWQAALKMSGVTLELLTDPEMHLFIERGIRGGIAMISKRLAIANNKYVPNFDSSKPSTFITYLDANNLYGWAMSQYLPTHGFEWVEGPVNYMDVADDSDVGYIMEVDLEYPAHLHDTHSDYPLAPERLVVTSDQLSEYQHTLLEKLDIKCGTVPKLVPNLQHKTRYTVHYRNLKQYINLGLKVTKTHRVLKFIQSPWLKTYIDFNTKQRKQAKSPFEKDLFKLLNNAVFGKTMENLRNRTNIELVHKEKRAKKLVACPTFHSFKIITEDLASIERRKNVLLLNRPIYVGLTILELSKTLMYNFHYAHIKKQYGENAKLLFTDTDSLCYEIQTEDIYQDMMNNLDLFDTSDYPAEHPLFSLSNKKVLGKFKDELAGRIALEFVGLKPKMYSLKSDLEEKKTAKGVQKNIVCRQIRHEDYKNCIISHQRGLAHANKITSVNHRIQTVTYTKSTLCPFDSKRFILSDGINTLAHGHHKIGEMKNV